MEQIYFEGGSQRMYPIDLRYVWPPEFDLMAELAGLSRRERWGREPFGLDSGKHISVYAAARAGRRAATR